MFMKLLLSFTLFLCLCFQVSSQDNNSKLLLSYSQEELNQSHQFRKLELMLGLKIKDKRQNFYWKDNDVVISIMSYGALKHLKTLKR